MTLRRSGSCFSLLAACWVAACCFAPSSRFALGDPSDVASRAVEDRIPEVYDRVAPAIVGITCATGTGTYFGTGTILDPTGLVVTSTTVVPPGARDVRIYLRGARVLPAATVLIEESDEVALVRIDAPAGERFPYVEVGDSGALELGDLALTFGNAFRSIETDDQVSLGFGIISGFYRLEGTLSQSKYTGPAIETTAPLNSGADGGPLIDSAGRLVGILSLNYSRSRWLGTAVPIARLVHLIRDHLSFIDERAEFQPVYTGMVLEIGDAGEVRVRAVQAGAPAAEAGIHEGDTIRSMGGGKIRTLDDARRAFQRARPGKPIETIVSRGGSETTLEIHAWGRF